MAATVLFLVSSAAMLHWGMGVLWGEVPNRSDVISPGDHAFAERLRARLLADHRVDLATETDFAWDTVCLIEPFELDQASLAEALRAGGLMGAPPDLPDGPRAIAQPNWMFAFLQDRRLVRAIEFHHREIEPRHGAYCVPRDRAEFVQVRQLARAVWIDLARP
ncbi:hypothetical protein [Geminicoccus roseus]|uniref:hypothetical protein n=1 Tax=Geminicoccus roseus TaxID=404900 RepID=UPI00040B1215|nr:hypothetical protein [Geminicoccus roseus]